MLDRQGRRRGAEGWWAPALVGFIVVISVIGLGLAGPTSADSKGVGLSGVVAFDDGAPAGGVTVDLFQAVNGWTRGHFLGSATTDSNGRYGFEVEAGCYITVAIAPLGAEFDFLGSGRVYSQLDGCVDEGSNHRLDSVLYREHDRPPTTTTAPPKTTTTAAPTTTTTAPPKTTTTVAPTTTRPPKPWERLDLRCNYGVAYEILGESLFFVRTSPREFPIHESYFHGFRLVFEGIDVTDSLRPDNDGQSRYFFDNPFPGLENVPRGQATLEFVDVSGAKRDRSYTIPCATYSPIAVDIDGSGAVERISGEFSFDFDADGTPDAVSEWFAPTEGILIDTRLDGELSGEHLFGDQGGLYADGFEKLALLDADGDGWVAGAELDGLALWADANGNARLDAGERSTLASHGIEALSVSHEGFVSEARLVDGTTRVTEDLWFPAANGSGGTDAVRVAVLGGAGIALLGYTQAAARRRRKSLDGELDVLLATETGLHT